MSRQLLKIKLLLIHITNQGAESKEAFQPDCHIKEIRVHWTPGEVFSNMRQEAKFEENLNRKTERKLLLAERKGEKTLEL